MAHASARIPVFKTNDAFDYWTDQINVIHFEP